MILDYLLDIVLPVTDSPSSRSVIWYAVALFLRRPGCTDLWSPCQLIYMALPIISLGLR